MVKHFGPMYIDFDEYPRYSGIISDFFEKIRMQIFSVIMVMLILQEKICTRVHEESWAMIKNCFPDANQTKQCPKSTLCKECTRVQKESNEKDGNIDSPTKNETTLSSSYFHGKPIVNVKILKKG